MKQNFKGSVKGVYLCDIRLPVFSALVWLVSQLAPAYLGGDINTGSLMLICANWDKKKYIH